MSHPLDPGQPTFHIPLRRLKEAPLNHLLKVSAFCPYLGVRRYFSLWLPHSFKQNQRLPIVYLFRGNYTEWSNPKEDLSRRGVFYEKVDLAIQQKRLPPMILLAPDFGADYRRLQTIACDWDAPHLRDEAPGMGTGKFESHFLKFLVPTVEKKLGLKDPHRIGIGFSLGGLNVCLLALRNPNLFQDVAAYDPSIIHEPQPQQDSILENTLLFDCVFNQPRNLPLVRVHSPQWIAQKLPNQQLERMSFYLQSGPKWSEPMDSNYQRTKNLIDVLRQRHIPNQFKQVRPQGRHNWDTCDRFSIEVLEHIFQKNSTSPR